MGAYREVEEDKILLFKGNRYNKYRKNIFALEIYLTKKVNDSIRTISQIMLDPHRLYGSMKNTYDSCAIPLVIVMIKYDYFVIIYLLL